MRPVVSAGKMLLPLFANRRRMKKALTSETGLIEQSLRPIPQRTTQPKGKGHPEAHFRPLDQLLRHILIQDLSQYPLTLSIADLHGKRQTPGGLQRYGLLGRHPSRRPTYNDFNSCLYHSVSSRRRRRFLIGALKPSTKVTHAILEDCRSGEYNL